MRGRRWFLLGMAFVLGVCVSMWFYVDIDWSSFMATRWVKKEESRRWDVIAGRGLVYGSGIMVVIDDARVRGGGEDATARLVVHEGHLLRLVNELFAAGAEAVSVNGERITAVTAMRCVGPAIRINDTNTVPPYEVKAIGNAMVLKSSIMMMGGVVDAMSIKGMKVDVKEMKQLVIEPYRGEFSLRYTD
ncbi:MAG: DUF881 domain-containing protein [bacterium]